MTIATQPTVTIVALIALSEEFDTFCETFAYLEDRSIGRTICVEHSVDKPNVRLISVLAEQMGAQSAGDSAAIALEHFAPDLIVVIGIAGAVSSDLAIGDVCVSNEIMDVLHNSKVEDGKAKGKSTEISFAPDFYHVNADLVAAFTFFKSHPAFKKSYETWRLESGVAMQAAALNDETLPSLHIAPIACGPVSASTTFNAKLKSLHRKVGAIETESGGVFKRIAGSRIPAIAIRGISDMADSQKATLETQTKGAARQVAMRNATELLQMQMTSERFLAVAKTFGQSGRDGQSELFALDPSFSPVASLDEEIKARLSELSPEFRARPEGFYLPIPRARRISYTEDLAEEGDIGPENILDCLGQHDRIVVRLSRSYPSQALGWALAHTLLRQQINDKVVLPFVVSGTAIRPPKSGLLEPIPSNLRGSMNNPEFERVLIIEEPCFESRSRLKFLADELSGTSAKILIITKAEDNVAASDAFFKDNGFVEYDISPISFSETAFFLERAFDMTATEAEAVAIRLDDTFRKFRLDAHPTYFAGLQEETLAALINANKRAELIQLAVDGLLTLIVAADTSRPNLSRTTRETFLKRVVLQMASSEQGLTDDQLGDLASEFLAERRFDVSQIEFLSPFFKTGLMYRAGGTVRFSHPYLRSYLLAQALRESEAEAVRYFEPGRHGFDYYAFDLYCEMGPSAAVIQSVIDYSSSAMKKAYDAYADPHVYMESGRKMAALSTPRQLASLTSTLSKTAKRLERQDADPDLRLEKQRILDARRHVRTEVVARAPEQAEIIPGEIVSEFEILDGLWRSLTLCTLSIGSGAEALDGRVKAKLAELVLGVATKFSDVWTRNRLRTDFNEVRAALLSDEQIWKYVSEAGLEEEAFAAIRTELTMALHGAELNRIIDPMGRVLWRVSAAAGVKVLAPILAEAETTDPVMRIFRASWMMDVDSEAGRDAMKAALNAYKGNPLLRMVLANHLLWRVYWHHYKTARSRHFVDEAKRALSLFGLAPSNKRIEQIKKGPRDL